MHEFWVTTARPGLMTENQAMAFFNDIAETMPEMELVAIDPLGRAIYRKPKED